MSFPLQFINRFIAALPLCLAVTPCLAQTVDIKWTEIVHDKIIIHYDIEDGNPNHEYQVSLFSSKDNFAAPLTKVSGDIGPDVKPGKDKIIMWAIIQELGSYKGKIELELTAKVFVPFIKLTSFDASKKYKRGKSYPMVWVSGNLSGQIDIDLYRGNNRISSERNVPNTGKFDWFVSPGAKPGKNYTLRFTNSKNRSEVIYSDAFSIRPKFPLILKVAVLTGLGAGAIILLPSGETGTNDKILPGIDQVGVPTTKN